MLIGERYPAILFKHVPKTLSFNDPYVSERVLAAAYGVAMSLVDSSAATTFRPLLGSLADTLYRNMFALRAGHATHHCLKRDYALGIIQLAVQKKCLRLPATTNRNLTTPFPNTPSVFSRSASPQSAVIEAIGYAIQMDFGNYTIGRLIPNRANYDDKNPDYVRVRSQIERRIYDLGYRKAQFEAIDQEIGRRFFQSEDKHKTDRYGKKYSWIAYFEMWGEREARKLLPDWRLHERTPDCGVDPSFPKKSTPWNPPLPDLFGDLEISTDEWVGGGFTPSWDPVLVVPEINGHTGPWILLEGFIQGEDPGRGRQLFAFLRGLFVSPKDIHRLQSKFMEVDYPGNRKIPDGAEEYYLYAGEAGRRDNYVRHLLMSGGTYRRQVGEAFDRYVPIKSAQRKQGLRVRIVLVAPSGEETGELVRPVAPIQRTRRIPGIRLELPAISFNWESYHSAENEFSGFDLPAPRLIQRLGLASRNREVDFREASGAPGILYRGAGGGWEGNRHKLLYCRADLLRQYLTQNRHKLVWCSWGERGWLTKTDPYESGPNPAHQRILQDHKHIHRSFAQWLW